MSSTRGGRDVEFQPSSELEIDVSLLLKYFTSVLIPQPSKLHVTLIECTFRMKNLVRIWMLMLRKTLVSSIVVCVLGIQLPSVNYLNFIALKLHGKKAATNE